MSFRIEFTELSKKDLDKLDNSQRLQILKSLTKLEALGMQAGEQLKGVLKDCRKLKHKKLGLRIVFREAADKIEIIEIVVIGKRADQKVYEIAQKRLGR